MSAAFLLIPIFISIFGGLYSRFIKYEHKKRKIISFLITLITSITTIIFIHFANDTKVVFINMDIMEIAFKIDGLGKIFATMLCILWPLSLLYSFIYMENEDRRHVYNGFYVMTFGVILGMCFSANLLTMYIFYEALTLITLPLIIHPQTKEARKAGRYYLYFSLSGSSLALIGLAWLLIDTGSLDFILGGITNNQLALPYLFTFLGFGVKAAIFPLCFWLPMASVAPTPTTALLHAVAVVKAGAFAIMRVTYYNFNSILLQNSWVNKVAICITIITIIYGSTMALKEQHFKRRLAYSTIANMSYILFGVELMSIAGLNAAILHMIYHSITKICLFFACGAIIKNSGATYVYELDGIGKKMPKVFIMFLIASLSVTGIPLLCGFVSKWALAMAAIEVGNNFAYLGIGALLISAMLSAVYSLSISIRAFVYKPNNRFISIYEKAQEPNGKYLLIIGFFAILCIIFGIWSTPMINWISSLIGGSL